MIAFLLHHLESVFAWLLTASWQASVLALVVLLAQRLLGPRLNPRWRHALWLLVLLRLLLPVLPESGLSLFQFAPPPSAPFVTIVTEPWHPIFTGQPYPAPSDPEPMAKPNYPFSSFTLLTLLWLTGAAILLLLTLEANRRFTRHVAHSPEISDPAILQAFADACAELHLRRPIRLIENSHVQSPAIMGLFRPTLLLPTDVRAKFDPRELRLIFLHELAHLQRGDLLIQALIALLQILHWFNPVLWYAFRRIRIDREPATDALVLSRAGEAEKERYGLMLIKLLQHFNQRHSLPTLVGILEDTDQFKRRFTLIAKFTRRAYGWSLLGVVLIGILAVACLTKSKSTNDAVSSYPVKKDILAATFWKKETVPQSATNAPSNPFYAALPFNDLAHPDAAQIWVPSAWKKAAATGQAPRSACLDRWLKITDPKGTSCYAQWADFGPECDDDPEYVFGNELPKIGRDGRNDGIDLSPGAAQYLGLDDKNRTVSWQFVDETAVPPGPWLPPPQRPILLASAQNGEPFEQAKPDAGPKGAPVRIQIIAIDAPDAAFHGPDAAERALKSYEHFRETQENPCGVNYLWSNNPSVPREIGSAASHTEMGNLAELIGNFPPPCPTVWCIPTPHDGKVSITGTITLNTEEWSGTETQRKLTIKPVPGASYPINLDLNFQQLQPVTAEGILEPAAAQAANDKVPRRLFVFLSAWPEDAAAPAADTGAPKSGADAQVPGPTPTPPAGDSTTVTRPVPVPGQLISTTLQQAIDWDNLEAARARLDAGDKVQPDDMARALGAMRNRIVKLFWERGDRFCSPLTYAISQGASAADVEKMLKAGSAVRPPEDKLIAPLAVAAINGNLPVVELLLDQGADPNDRGALAPRDFISLQEAVAGRHPDIVAALLDHGAVPDWQTVDTAVHNCDPEIPGAKDERPVNLRTLQILAAHGALERVPKEMRGNLLVSACLRVHDMDVVRLLLAHGFRPDDRDALGTTTVLQRVRNAVEGRDNWPPDPAYAQALALLENPPAHADAAPDPAVMLTTIRLDLPAFSGASLDEVVTQLSRATVRNDPAHQGISFVVPQTDAARALRLDLPALKNVPVADAVNAIAREAKLTYTVNNGAVYLRLLSDSVGALTVRTFLVPAGFFAPAPATETDVKTQLLARGISFTGDSSATYLREQGKIVVRGTPEALDALQTILEAAAKTGHADAAPAAATTVLAANTSGSSTGAQPPALDMTQKELLNARLDAASRHVLVSKMKALPDEEFVETMQGLGRADSAITDLDKKIAEENADITNLINDGFSPDHPRVVSMRAEVDARQAELKRLVEGLRQAMDLDLQMADSRVALLERSSGNASAARGLANLQQEFLTAREDADARRVLFAKVKVLPDDEFDATMQGLARSEPNLDDLDKKIADENADITNLINDGFSPDHPRVVSMRAEIDARKQERHRLIDGMRRAIEIDLQMADSRVESLRQALADSGTNADHH